MVFNIQGKFRDKINRTRVRKINEIEELSINKKDETVIKTENHELKTNNTPNQGKNYTKTNIKKEIKVIKPRTTNKKNSDAIKKIPEKEKLEQKIIKKIDKLLIKEKIILEEIESELFVIKNMTNDRESLEEINQIKNRIKLLQEKINKLKRQYQVLYEDNYYDDIVDLKQADLIDDIDNYKKLVDKEEIKLLTESYQELQSFIEIKDTIEEVEKYNNALEEKVISKKKQFEIRDQDFNEVKYQLIKQELEKSHLTNKIEEENERLEKLIKEVSKITSYEKNQTKIDGIGDYISNGLKFLGASLLSPLFTPLKIVYLKNMVQQSLNNIRVVNTKKIIYQASDYLDEIRNSLDNISHIKKNIDSSITDIHNLKEIFNQEFQQNLNIFPEYLKVYNNINKMYESLLESKARTLMIEYKMEKNKQLNEETLKKVRKLNG